MSNTITNLIETININFPVAGKSNDSQGFRDNFNIIQQSLLLTQGEIDTIQNSLAQANSILNVSVPHVNGQIDLTVGQPPYRSSLSLNNNNDLVVTSVGNIILNPNSGVPVIAFGAYGLTDSVTNLSTGTFAVDNVRNISTGSTIVFPLISGTYTVSEVDYVNNWITVTPPIPDYPEPFSVGDVLTFFLPYTPSNDGTQLIVNGSITATNATISGTLNAKHILENGSPLAPSSTIDTTNASNITSGTLSISRLSADTISGVTLGSNLYNLTFSNSGNGAASGTTYNGSSPVIISYNSIGAPKADGTGASGSWGINITGNAGYAANFGGQTWYDVTGSRSSGVWYQNTRTYTMFVGVRFCATYFSYVDAYVWSGSGPVTMNFASESGASSGDYHAGNACFPVPPGWFYLIDWSLGTPVVDQHWQELY